MSQNKISALKKKDDDVEEVDLSGTQYTTTVSRVDEEATTEFDIKYIFIT